MALPFTEIFQEMGVQCAVYPLPVGFGNNPGKIAASFFWDNGG
jgi:hypothetical protein